MRTQVEQTEQRPALSITQSYDHIAEALSKWQGYINFKQTESSVILSRLPYDIIAMFFGNRGGKTCTIAKNYIDRALGIHPIAKKVQLMRKVRCMSSTLPESSDPDVQDNAQYIELRKLIPNELIKSDVTARSQNLVIHRPEGLGSRTTVFEFRSSKQEMQDLGKIDLSSVWHDEETPQDKRVECKMRLMGEGGDEIFSLTMTNPLSYMFDEIWSNTDLVFRTKTIADKFGLPQLEHKKSGKSIACLLGATDDNPTLDIEDVERIFESVTDPDVLALRRYSVFKQVSGRIHKSYNPQYCYIGKNKYFPDGMPYNWFHARGIDFHESRIPWSVGWVSASPDDEWFLWQEFHPAIDGQNAYSTGEIAKAIVRKSGSYLFLLNLIDPLATKKQPNTLFSTVDDLNRHFDQLRKEEGIGTPAFWQGWDTKGTTGRDEIGKRFKNATKCGRPFNNKVKDKGRTITLPTLWILDSCPNFHKSLLSWCYDEWIAQATRASKDQKISVQQKHSHDPMVLEALAKDHRLLYASHYMRHKAPHDNYKAVSVTGR